MLWSQSSERQDTKSEPDAANECRSREDGDIIDEVVIVELKSFAELESVCKLCLHISKQWN